MKELTFFITTISDALLFCVLCVCGYYGVQAVITQPNHRFPNGTTVPKLKKAPQPTKGPYKCPFKIDVRGHP